MNSVFTIAFLGVLALGQRTRIGDIGTTPGTVVSPRVIESKTPIYTEEAISARIEGTVILEATFDIDGKATVLRVVKGLGYGLDQRAIGSVLDWKFAPATRNDIPVEVVSQIDVDFKLPPDRVINGMTVVRIGGGVLPPAVIERIEPEYSEEAGQAHYQGTVVIEAVIRKDGAVDVLRVVRPLGFGLDEKAVTAIKQWKFRPGTRNGQTVDVVLNIDVDFNLR